MKKTLKRLSLHRETLRNLQPADLRPAVGRGDTHEIQTGCACTDTCDTNNGCGTGGSAACGSAGCTQELMTTCVC